MSILDGIKNKKIEVAPEHSINNDTDTTPRKIPLLAKLAVKIVGTRKDSIDDELTPKEFLTLNQEIIKALNNLVSKRFPNKIQKDDIEEQIETAHESFISELSEPDSNTPLIRAIKANIVRYQPFTSENPSECYYKINGYIYKRLFTLLKKYASDQDRDYMSLNDSVKGYLAKLVEKGIIEKYNHGYRLSGNEITRIIDPANPDKSLVASIDFRREQRETKAVNYNLPQNIDKIVSKLQNTFFESRDITELLYNHVYQMKVILDNPISSGDDSPSILENIAAKIKTPEELAIEKISNEEIVSVSEIISEIEFQLDSECKQVNQIQKNRNKYRMIQLGYLASQTRYFENDDIKKMHKEHLDLLTPNHPDYANRILNFLDKFIPTDSDKIKAGLSTIKSCVASYNSAFEIATDNLTLENQLRVKQEYASKLVKHYFELLGEA